MSTDSGEPVQVAAEHSEASGSDDARDIQREPETDSGVDVETGAVVESGPDVDTGPDVESMPDPEVAAGPVGEELRGAVEAILVVVDEPVTAMVIAQVLAVPEVKVIEVLDGLRADYDQASRGFELRQIGSGWRLYTRADYATYVERFVLDGQQARLTQAALETLAVVAYRQPVSRSRVSAVRGVNVDGVMRTLVSRGLVEEAGSEHESNAVLYRTTSYFLERLGLRELDELPNLANFLPESTTIDQLEDELSSEGRDAKATK
jgi:segregation and condensation protein B